MPLLTKKPLLPCTDHGKLSFATNAWQHHLFWFTRNQILHRTEPKWLVITHNHPYRQAHVAFSGNLQVRQSCWTNCDSSLKSDYAVWLLIIPFYVTLPLWLSQKMRKDASSVHTSWANSTWKPSMTLRSTDFTVTKFQFPFQPSNFRPFYN